MHPWQVAVEHDHVVVVDERARQTGRSVERDIDGHAGLAQAERDRPGHLLVVLDHEHSHVHQATSRWFQHGFASGLVSAGWRGGDTFPKPSMLLQAAQSTTSRAARRRHARPRQTQRRPEHEVRPEIGSGSSGRGPHRPRRARGGLRGQLADRGRGEPLLARVQNVHDELDGGRVDGSVANPRRAVRPSRTRRACARMA